MIICLKSTRELEWIVINSKLYKNYFYLYNVYIQMIEFKL